MKIANRTAHIKPSTRNALMDQLALAADTIILQREMLDAEVEWWSCQLDQARRERWWRALLAWWRK